MAGDLGFAVQFNAEALWPHNLQTTHDDTTLPPAIILIIKLSTIGPIITCDISFLNDWQ